MNAVAEQAQTRDDIRDLMNDERFVVETFADGSFREADLDAPPAMGTRRMMCHFTGQTRDGRTVEWNRGEWSGDHDLIRQADALRRDDDSLRAIAQAIAEAVGADGMLSAAVRQALEER